MCRPTEPTDTASALSDTVMASTLSDIIMASAISDTGKVCLRMVTTTPMALMASTTRLSFTSNKITYQASKIITFQTVQGMSLCRNKQNKVIVIQGAPSFFCDQIIIDTRIGVSYT
ncbi:unnamed protein product [Ixodes pacificus]